MKKIILFPALIIFLAGFLAIPEIVNAQASTNSCQRKTVRLQAVDGQRVWQECPADASGDARNGCTLRFCNATPTMIGTTPTWKAEDCNKYCVGFQESIPMGDQKIKSISGDSGTDLAMEYVSMLYKFGASLMGILAILVIVVSGVQMMTGGAEEANYTDAKDRILQAIFSLAILFSSALILRTVNPDFFI